MQSREREAEVGGHRAAWGDPSEELVLQMTRKG